MVQLSLDDFDNSTINTSDQFTGDIIDGDTYIEDRIEFNKLVDILNDDDSILSPYEYERFLFLLKKYRLKAFCKNQKNLMKTILQYKMHKNSNNI